MLQISTRDETFLELNSVMTLRHSRKRDKIYLKKLFYLRNFLNLLQFYRVYLGWKFRKRLRNAVDWHRRQPIAWKPIDITIHWNPNCYQCDNASTVIFRFYQCQLTMTFVIRSPRLFFIDISAFDKIVNISFGRETLRRNLLTVCERKRAVDVDNEILYCETGKVF